MHIIFDIDGTLADASDRLKHITGEGKAKDWDAFFAAENIFNDEPILPVMHIFYNSPHAWLLTGRPERTRAATCHWFEACSFNADLINDHLLMRADDDRRPSHEVKRDHLHALRARGIHPQLAFEDRKADAEMYRSEGVLTALLGDGDF